MLACAPIKAAQTNGPTGQTLAKQRPSNAYGNYKARIGHGLQHSNSQRPEYRTLLQVRSKVIFIKTWVFMGWTQETALVNVSRIMPNYRCLVATCKFRGGHIKIIKSTFGKMQNYFHATLHKKMKKNIHFLRPFCHEHMRISSMVTV